MLVRGDVDIAATGTVTVTIRQESNPSPNLVITDLVAQSVNKLVTILDEVEHKLLQLVVVFGPYQKQAAKTDQGKASEMLKQLEATKNTSMDQDLADEILKQFGFN